ncbi:glycosyltransferase involved in cell wall biosynthesis [Tamilnaduibacter salinus]|uniref:Glycosyltransferase involved in cell wall biosynthesis n=1 Tax=Tamilnaduibacter salinus TaxID=1484056 RepID=A0A2A2I1W8_9GAMM|nr:glycosyltransferase family 4 protein [Tamilnaduibacter salinus]PAV24993.1 hypothetical protein CF392_13310 [Tamilnaduibacter salinus]PVY70832.1 glycosyltransferase involved in cell wall biosynthesis [Tamilnaduibacter salinus]
MSGSKPPFAFDGIRILFIGHDPIGTTGTASKYFYPVIAAQLGAKVAVVGDWSGAAPQMPWGIRVFDVSMAGGGRCRAKKVREVVRNFCPDVVHVFFHRGFGWYRYHCGDLGAKWVVDVRGPLLATGLRRSVSRLLNNCERLGYDATAGHSIGSVDTVFGKWVAKSACHTRIGVDVKQFAQRSHLTSGPFRFVYVGGIDRRRQLETMLRAFALASKKMNLTLDLIGDGDDTEALMDLVSREGINGVRFLGRFPHSKIAEMLAVYDGALSYIGPSVYDSGPPLKTLEYFAAGLPVVASDTRGNRMLMSAGVEGVFDPEGTTESLSDAMVQLAGSDIQVLSGNARRKAEASSWQQVVPVDLSNLYSRILA